MTRRTERILGAAVDRVLGAHPPRTSLNVVLTAWRDEDLAAACFQRVVDALKGRDRTVVLPERPHRQSRWRETWWIAPPDRCRVDVSPAGSQAKHRYWVWTGSEGYAWRGAGPAYPADEQQPPVHAHMFDPSHYVPRFQLSLAGRGVVHGRPCTKVRARPYGWSDRREQMGVGLPAGADEHLLCIDDQLGIVSRLESQIDGVPFWRATIRHLAIGEELPSSLFRPAAIERAPRPASTLLSDEQVISRVPFALYHYGPFAHWSIEERSGDLIVRGSLRWGSRFLAIRQRSARPTPEIPAEATSTTRGSVTLHVAEAEQGDLGRQRWIFVRLGDTEVCLGPSDASDEELIAAALTLRPVTGRRPQLIDA